MKLLRLTALGALAFATGACSTIIEGTSQNISVSTQPPEASCELVRDGVVIGLISSTPGSVKVEKNKQNIIITCKKDGYRDGVYRNESDFAGATAGNILLGGIIGVGIDAATGAANKYDGDVAIVLESLPAAAPAPVTPAVAAPVGAAARPSS